MNAKSLEKLTYDIDYIFSANIRERMKKKRNQLSSHLPNMVSIACTVASERLPSSVFGGYFLQINLKSSKPLKGVFEGYCLDERNAHPLSPILYTLFHLYALRLFHLPLTLHITSEEALQRLESLPTENDPIAEAITVLLSHFPSVSFAPCLQGFFFEKMHSRLRQLQYEQINEFTPLDFKLLASICL